MVDLDERTLSTYAIAMDAVGLQEMAPVTSNSGVFMARMHSEATNDELDAGLGMLSHPVLPERSASDLSWGSSTGYQAACIGLPPGLQDAHVTLDAVRGGLSGHVIAERTDSEHREASIRRLASALHLEVSDSLPSSPGRSLNPTLGAGITEPDPDLSEEGSEYYDV